jgi:hypothetical protein
LVLRRFTSKFIENFPHLFSCFYFMGYLMLSSFQQNWFSLNRSSETQDISFLVLPLFGLKRFFFRWHYHLRFRPTGSQGMLAMYSPSVPRWHLSGSTGLTPLPNSLMGSLHRKQKKSTVNKNKTKIQSRKIQNLIYEHRSNEIHVRLTLEDFQTLRD